MLSLPLAALLAASAPDLPAAPSVPAVPEAAVPAAPAASEPAGAAPSDLPPVHAEAAPPAPPAPPPVPPRGEPPAGGERRRAQTPRLPAEIPPALTAQALADELRRGARERAAARSALAEERARLVRLAAEIADARAALKEETAKLESLLRSGTRAGAPAARGGASEAAPPSPLESLARALKSMRPEQGAVLVARLDRALAAAILDRMRPADAAAVLEKLDPSNGAELFALLARRLP